MIVYFILCKVLYEIRDESYLYFWLIFIVFIYLVFSYFNIKIKLDNIEKYIAFLVLVFALIFALNIGG